MKRENRYFVLKRTDMGAALTKREIDRLHALGEKVAKARREKRKPALHCVVVEKDWPEYEPTWKAIERRVASESVGRTKVTLSGGATSR